MWRSDSSRNRGWAGWDDLALPALDPFGATTQRVA